MDENKEEIQKLRKQVRNLRIAFLLTQIGFLIISIIDVYKRQGEAVCSQKRK